MGSSDSIRLSLKEAVWWHPGYCSGDNA